MKEFLTQLENEKCLLISNFLLHFKTFRIAFILVQLTIGTVTGQFSIQLFWWLNTYPTYFNQYLNHHQWYKFKKWRLKVLCLWKSWNSFNINWNIFKTSDTHKILLKAAYFYQWFDVKPTWGKRQVSKSTFWIFAPPDSKMNQNMLCIE